MSSFWPVALVAVIHCLIFPTAVNAEVAFVRPNSSVSCASSSQQPCLTFNEYAQQVEQYFVDDTTFLFLHGTHQLDFQLDLEGLSNISFAPLDNQNDTVQLLLSLPFNITFTDCTDIEISRLVFILSGKRMNVFVPYGRYEDSPQLAFQNATGHLSQLTLTGSGTGTFVACFSSHVQISNLVANGIKAQTLYANNSIVDFYGQNRFHNNHIGDLAEALYILTLENCYYNFYGNASFVNNSRAAVAAYGESHTIISGDLLFLSNTINSTLELQSAMNFSGGTCNISGNVLFKNNTAPYRGNQITLLNGATCYIPGSISFLQNDVYSTEFEGNYGGAAILVQYSALSISGGIYI